MEKLQVAGWIVGYRFSPEPGKHFGFNIFALLDERERAALLIDTAYEEQAAAVRSELSSIGYTVIGTIISHFHPDHVMGLKALPGVAIHGSVRFEETLRHYTDDEERRAFTPTDPVTDETRFEFGEHRLTFRLAPGHTPCTLYTFVGERFVHVADHIMTSNTGQDILPWAAFDLIPDHIDSLEMLRRFADRTFLLSHGVILRGERQIHEAIDNRLAYFRAVLEGRGRISYEEAVRDCSCDFLHKEWLIQKG